MNTYRISADLTPGELAKWLTNNDCPKAAASVKEGNGFKAEFVMAGNASTISVLQVFEKIPVRYECKAIGESEPILMIGQSSITFAQG